MPSGPGYHYSHKIPLLPLCSSEIYNEFTFGGGTDGNFSPSSNLDILISIIMSDTMSPAKVEPTPTSNHDEKLTSSDDDGLPPDVAALMQEFTGAKYNKLMRKMDLHLIPIVSLSSCTHIAVPPPP